MKVSVRVAFAGLLLVLMATGSALAAGAAGDGILSFQGNVQICESAEAGARCHPAVQGQEVPVGSHLMIGPEASATMTYKGFAANGYRDTVVKFTKQGLYTINARLIPGINTYDANEWIAANLPFASFAALIAAAGVAASANGSTLVPISP